MGSLFDNVAETIQKECKDWNFQLTPEEVGRRLMRTLPDVKTIVALHSNPGPKHTFVDPASGKPTGVIVFGDAYSTIPSMTCAGIVLRLTVKPFWMVTWNLAL